MKLTGLLLFIFPIMVAILALLVGYMLREVEKSLDNVRIYKETTLELTVPEFSMGNTNTIFDPYASAELMLRESKSMFESDKVGWYMQHNSKESSIESRILDEDRCVHRVSVVLESGLNISRLFQALISESFVASLYPATFNSSFLNINNARDLPLLAFDWAHGKLGLRYVTVSTMFPFYDRAFALFNLLHPSTHTFVSRAVPLSPLDEQLLLPVKNRFKATVRAQLSMALRVVPQPYSLPTADHLTVYRIEIIYYVSDFFWDSSVDYHLTVKHFIPTVVRKIQHLLR